MLHRLRQQKEVRRQVRQEGVLVQQVQLKLQSQAWILVGVLYVS